MLDLQQQIFVSHIIASICSTPFETKHQFQTELPHTMNYMIRQCHVDSTANKALFSLSLRCVIYHPQRISLSFGPSLQACLASGLLVSSVFTRILYLKHKDPQRSSKVCACLYDSRCIM
jgi:hypothetical protein